MTTRRLAVAYWLILLLAAPAVAAKHPRAIFENLGPTTYLPGQHVALVVSNPPAEQVSIYAVPPDRVVGRLLMYGRGPDLTLGLTQVAGGTLELAKNEPTRSFDAGALPPGYYVAAIGGGDDRREWLFSVTSFGLAISSIKGNAVVWAVDLRTLNRFTQPLSLTVLSGQMKRPLAVDADGVAIDRDTPNGGTNILLAVAADGSRQILNEPVYFNGDADGIYVATDRPIYRPGQAVYVRAILRNGNVGHYTIPRGSIHLKVTSLAEDRTIFDHSLQITRFGTVSTAVRLPANAALGEYGISLRDNRQNGYFTVAAYRKPEATMHLSTDRAWTIAGDTATVHVTTKYLFGIAAGGMRLHYFIGRYGAYTLADAYPGSVPYAWLRPGHAIVGYATIDEGDATTDARGEYDLTFRAPPLDGQAQIGIDVRGADASGRSVATRLAIVEHPSSLDIAVTPERWFTAAGQARELKISTHTYDDHASPNVALTLSIRKIHWNQRDRRFDEISREEHPLVTDASGNAVFAWTPTDAGTYSIVAGGTDQRGRVATGSAYMTVLNAEDAGELALSDERPEIVPEKLTLAPGERARCLVLLPVANRDIEVTVASDRTQTVRIVHVAGNAAVLEEAPPRDAARFGVSVTLPNEAGTQGSVALLSVDPPPRKLNVRVTPNKSRYAPGETARLKIDVHDASGRPVRSEVALGVVDEGIYNLERDYSSPFDVFYGYSAGAWASGKWDLATKPYRSERRVIAHVMAMSAARVSVDSSEDSSVVQVRKNFLDTAFWAPSVVTNARGQALVSFSWPDNLTTWRATGTAVTTRTDIGSATASVVVTKDFLVRLEVPRFLRVGDRLSVIAIAHGLSATSRLAMRLGVSGAATVEGEAAPPTMDFINKLATQTWNVRATDVGDSLLTLLGSDSGRKDAVQTSAPVEGTTPEEHVVSGGAGNARVRVTIPAGYQAGRLTVTLSPSILAQLMRSLHLLQVYPYECTEQTLSAALPALFVNRFIRRMHASDAFELHASTIAVTALERLRELAHADGSYGWWDGDAAHPFMTAYALYALAEFKKDGYPIYLNRTVGSLIDQLQSSNDDTLRFWGGRQAGSEWNTRAFMLFALSDAAPERVDPAMLAQARAHADRMNPYALAVLGLAEHAVGDDAAARDLLRDLNTRVSDDGTIAYWPGQTWDYAWENDPVETTAYALRLEYALDPGSVRIPRIVEFLQTQMRNGWAYTTKDTAATMYALAEALPPDTNELHPNETVSVVVDGKTVYRLHIVRPILDAADADVVIPASAIHDGSTIRLEREGAGALYWSMDLVRYGPPTARTVVNKETPLLERLFPPKPEVSIVRRYTAKRPGRWRAGERVGVEITVTSRQDLDYVSIEDPLPAGAEHSVEQWSATMDAWSGLSFLDDRTTFFADRLSGGKPLTLRYSLDATTAGVYTAPPPVVYSMYGPPFQALGNAETITILPI